MDQAKTLRQLLGTSRPLISPILGDIGTNYAACLARFVLEQHACQHKTALLFDSSEHGLRELFSAHCRDDLIEFFKGRANLEDQVLELSAHQYVVIARQGLDVLTRNPGQAEVLLGKLHRLPVTCDAFYATLPYEAWRLAAQLAPAAQWFWIVHPKANSVTRVFQGIRSSSGVDENCRHRVIVAGVRNTDEADHVFSNLLESTSHFLTQPLQYAGHMPLLEDGKPLNRISRDMISAGRRIAKLICSLDEHALAS